MKYKVAILTPDRYLKRKLELILSDKVIFTEEGGADVIFSSQTSASPDARVVSVGRGEGYSLKIPFSDKDVLALLPERNEGGAGISMVGDRIFLDDKEIRLTELEEALFMKLYEARGEFVGRDELFSVFAEGASQSMLNVYIHYLREKLEIDGEKIIISSRKHGYKISEKFTGGRDA